MATGTWPLSFATGDTLLAAEYRKGIGCIADSTLGGSAASVDMTSIVGTYAHLLVVVYARCDLAAALTTLTLRFNADSAANYDTQELQAAGATVNPAEAFGQTSIRAGYLPANTAGANLFGTTWAFIPHYAGSANNKSYVSVTSMKTGTSTTNIQVILTGGFWRSNAAITRITLLPGGGSNFVAGTRVSLYGLGA